LNFPKDQGKKQGMKSLLSLLTFGILALTIPTQATARDFGGFSLNVPQGWEILPAEPPVRAALRSPNGEGLIAVITAPSTGDEKAVQNFLAGMRDSLRGQGIELQNVGTTRAGDLDLHTFQANLPDGREIQVYIGASTQMVFGIQAIGRPIGPEVNSALLSFKIPQETIIRGQPPLRSGVDKGSPAYKSGQWGGFGLLTIIFALVVNHFYKKRKKA
jgi:hypothetical protein